MRRIRAGFRKWRQESFVRWWPLQLKVLAVLVFASGALNVFVLTQVNGLVGQNTARIADETRDRLKAEHANVRARYDDCVAGNDLRKGLVLVARQQQLPTATLRRLFPNVPESLLQRAHATFRLELQLFGPRDCLQYAREAIPNGGLKR